LKIKPKYLLKYSGKEIVSDNLEDLTKIAKNLTQYYEIFRVYRAVHTLEQAKIIYTPEDIKKALSMEERGHKRDVIARQMGMSRWYLDKILGPKQTA
jgi:hypothetical protein